MSKWMEREMEQSSATIFKAPFNLQEVGHTNGEITHTVPSLFSAPCKAGWSINPFANQKLIPMLAAPGGPIMGKEERRKGLHRKC